MVDNVNGLNALPIGATGNNVPAHIQLLKDDLNGGSIIRRLTGAQISALAAPQKPAGLVVYNTTTGKLQISDGTNFADIPAMGSAGAWTSYTPTVGGWTIGNGTAAGKYLRLGQTIIGWAKLTLGTTTSITGSALTLTLPVTGTGTPQTGTDCILYAATAYSKGAAFLGASTVSVYRMDYSVDARALITSSLPRTWTSGNFVEVSFTYEAA